MGGHQLDVPAHEAAMHALRVDAGEIEVAFSGHEALAAAIEAYGIDRLGYQQGSVVLKQIARRLQELSPGAGASLQVTAAPAMSLDVRREGSTVVVRPRTAAQADGTGVAVGLWQRAPEGSAELRNAEMPWLHATIDRPTELLRSRAGVPVAVVVDDLSALTGALGELMARRPLAPGVEPLPHRLSTRQDVVDMRTKVGWWNSAAKVAVEEGTAPDEFHEVVRGVRVGIAATSDGAFRVTLDPERPGQEPAAPLLAQLASALPGAGRIEWSDSEHAVARQPDGTSARGEQPVVDLAEAAPAAGGLSLANAIETYARATGTWSEHGAAVRAAWQDGRVAVARGRGHAPSLVTFDLGDGGTLQFEVVGLAQKRGDAVVAPESTTVQRSWSMRLAGADGAASVHDPARATVAAVAAARDIDELRRERAEPPGAAQLRAERRQAVQRGAAGAGAAGSPLPGDLSRQRVAAREDARADAQRETERLAAQRDAERQEAALDAARQALGARRFGSPREAAAFLVGERKIGQFESMPRLLAPQELAERIATAAPGGHLDQAQLALCLLRELPQDQASWESAAGYRDLDGVHLGRVIAAMATSPALAATFGRVLLAARSEAGAGDLRWASDEVARHGIEDAADHFGAASPGVVRLASLAPGSLEQAPGRADDGARDAPIAADALEVDDLLDELSAFRMASARRPGASTPAAYAAYLQGLRSLRDRWMAAEPPDATDDELRRRSEAIDAVKGHIDDALVQLVDQRANGQGIAEEVRAVIDEEVRQRMDRMRSSLRRSSTRLQAMEALADEAAALGVDLSEEVAEERAAMFRAHSELSRQTVADRVERVAGTHYGVDLRFDSLELRYRDPMDLFDALRSLAEHEGIDAERAEAVADQLVRRAIAGVEGGNVARLDDAMELAVTTSEDGLGVRARSLHPPLSVDPAEMTFRLWECSNGTATLECSELPSARWCAMGSSVVSKPGDHLGVAYEDLRDIVDDLATYFADVHVPSGSLGRGIGPLEPEDRVASEAVDVHDTTPDLVWLLEQWIDQSDVRPSGPEGLVQVHLGHRVRIERRGAGGILTMSMDAAGSPGGEGMEPPAPDEVVRTFAERARREAAIVSVDAEGATSEPMVEDAAEHPSLPLGEVLERYCKAVGLWRAHGGSIKGALASGGLDVRPQDDGSMLVVVPCDALGSIAVVVRGAMPLSGGLRRDIATLPVSAPWTVEGALAAIDDPVSLDGRTLASATYRTDRAMRQRRYVQRVRMAGPQGARRRRSIGGPTAGELGQGGDRSALADGTAAQPPSPSTGASSIGGSEAGAMARGSARSRRGGVGRWQRFAP